MKAQLEQLKTEILSCQKCELSKTRNHVIFGEGNEHAPIMVAAKYRELVDANHYSAHY